MITFTLIRYLGKVVAHLRYCLEIAYQHIEQFKEWQEEDRSLMVKIVADSKDIIEFTNKFIKDNENLCKTPEQKSK